MRISWPSWWSGSKPSVGPAWWEAYLALFPCHRPANMPVDDLPFVVLDTETTGLRVGTDRILSLGAVRVQGGRILVEESREWLVEQTYPSGSNAAIEVHGLLPKARPDTLEEGTMLARLLEFIGSSVLVGHHIDFDVKMLEVALRGQGGGRLENATLDTARLARRLDPPHRPVPANAYALDTLCARYGIRPEARHTAAGDAMLTAVLLLKLLEALAARGVRSWGDLR